jgi:transposase-like protein
MQPREKRRRRRHTAEFKAAAVAACREPGASVAAVALERKLNANLLRTWINRFGKGLPSLPKVIAAPEMSSFLPLRIDTPSPPTSTTERPIRVHIRKGRTRVTIEWPAAAAGACALWLRELLG